MAETVTTAASLSDTPPKTPTYCVIQDVSSDVKLV